MEERKFKGIWIPKEIWTTDELTLQEKVMLVEIDSLDDEEHGCYASNKYFSNFFKLTTQRVSQIINSLSDKGFIKISYEYQGKEIDKRTLKINRPPYPEIEVSNKIDTYQENDNTGYQEKFKENNTNLNNKENNNNKLLLSKNFKKPTLEEVQEYCRERGNTIDAEYFIDYYESKGWLVGRTKMKDWKAAIRLWEHKSTKKVDKQKEIDEMCKRLAYLDEEN